MQEAGWRGSVFISANLQEDFPGEDNSNSCRIEKNKGNHLHDQRERKKKGKVANHVVDT